MPEFPRLALHTTMDDSKDLEHTNLPSLIDDSDITLPSPQHVTIDAPLKTIQQSDLDIANSMLDVMYLGFSKATSISSLCKLAQQTMSIVKERRNILNQPYGAQNQSSKSGIYDPLD